MNTFDMLFEATPDGRLQGSKDLARRVYLPTTGGPALAQDRTRGLLQTRADTDLIWRSSPWRPQSLAHTAPMRSLRVRSGRVNMEANTSAVSSAARRPCEPGHRTDSQSTPMRRDKNPTGRQRLDGVEDFRPQHR